MPALSRSEQQIASARVHARMETVLAHLGNPQLGLPVVHVGGTNGKGSVCALLTSVLKAAGFKVGRFTSPHLESWTERIWLDGQTLAVSEFEALLAEVESAELLCGDGLGEFARVTAASFVYFQRTRPDVLLLEVGRGGRYDATNVVPAPLLSIITNVADDHAEVLGPTEADIAWHKAGIAKRGRPLLTSATGEAYPVLDLAARETWTSLVQVPVASYVSPSPCGQRIGFRGQTWDLGLLGTYQLQNAALAIAAVRSLRAQGWEISDDALRQGLAQATWPGRMELWQDGSDRWLFDGAHNLAGARELAASLARHCPGEDLVLVFGAMHDKPGAAMLAALAPLASQVVLTAPPSPAALDPRDLAALQPNRDVTVEADPLAALATARQQAHGRLIVVCGSLYLVGLARSFARAPAP